jgi:hypothetical protein
MAIYKFAALVCVSFVFLFGAQKREASKEVRSTLFKQGYGLDVLKTSTNGYLDVLVTARNNAATASRSWTGTLPANGDTPSSSKATPSVVRLTR